MEWVSVKQNLPEKGATVDIFHEEFGRMTKWYMDSYSPSDPTLYWYSEKLSLFNRDQFMVNNCPITHWILIEDPE